jgi:hypothetical protein
MNTDELTMQGAALLHQHLADALARPTATEFLPSRFLAYQPEQKPMPIIPKKPKEALTHKVALWVTQRQAHDLDKISRETGRGTSEIVRLALDAAIADYHEQEPGK